MYDTKKMCHITIIQKAKHLKIYVTAVQEHKNLFWARRYRSFKTQESRYLDASAPALAHSVGDGGSGGVDHGHEAYEAQLLRGEVHLLRVEGEPLWELIVGKVVMAEAWRRWGKNMFVLSWFGCSYVEDLKPSVLWVGIAQKTKGEDIVFIIFRTIYELNQ